MLVRLRVGKGVNVGGGLGLLALLAVPLLLPVIHLTVRKSLLYVEL